MPRSSGASGRASTGMDRPSDTSLSGGMDSGSEAPQDGRSNKKLDYSRVSVACSRCRQRKMRCEPNGDETGGPCRKCIKGKQECVYEPVDHGGPVPSASAPRGQTGVLGARTVTAPSSTTFERAQLHNPGSQSASGTQSSYASPSDPFSGPPPFSAFSQPSPGVPYNVPQGMDVTRPMLPFREPNPHQHQPVRREFPPQAQGYGNPLGAGYPPAQPVSQSTYAPDQRLSQSDYVTSTAAESWRQDQIPILPSTTYDASHLYQPPADYSPFGVPRRAETMPYAPLPIPHQNHPGTSHSPHSYYMNNHMNTSSEPNTTAIQIGGPHVPQPTQPNMPGPPFRGRGTTRDPYQQYQQQFR